MLVLCSACRFSINRVCESITGCVASLHFVTSLRLLDETNTKLHMEALKSTLTTLHHIYLIVILLHLQLIKNNLLNMVKKKKKREHMKDLMLRMRFPDLNPTGCSVVQDWHTLMILLMQDRSSSLSLIHVGMLRQGGRKSNRWWY